jgi:hypothetical protein
MGTQGEGAFLEFNIDWTGGRSLNIMGRGLVSSLDGSRENPNLP